MGRSEIIGEGYEHSRPYEIRIIWDDEKSVYPRAIEISEGSGHSSFGGLYSLSEILNETWTYNLEVCKCMWLRDLAKKEQSLGRGFSADEIFAVHQQLQNPES